LRGININLQKNVGKIFYVPSAIKFSIICMLLQ